MIYILIFVCSLSSLTKISADQPYCELDKKGRNKCHDGGCNNPNSENDGNTCLCSLSKNVMYGKYCGRFEDKCSSNPCQNNGKCQSGIGHHICECREEFYGINCEKPINKGNKSNIIRRLSIFYRIKCSLGENVNLLLVSETFGDCDYDIILKSTFDFRYKLNVYKKQNMKVSEVEKECLNIMTKSYLHKLNNCNGPDNEDCQNTCNLISKLYDNNKKVEMAIITYFNTKTENGKEDVFFDENKTQRMGMKYNLELQLISEDKDQFEYKIPFIQFVIENKVTLCLPFIDQIEYIKYYGNDHLRSPNRTKESVHESSIIKINKNENLKFNVLFKNDSKCPITRYESKYRFVCKILDIDKPIENFLKQTDSSKAKEAQLVHCDNSTYHLLAGGFPKGMYIIFFIYFSEDLEPDDPDTFVPKFSVSFLRTVEFFDTIDTTMESTTSELTTKQLTTMKLTTMMSTTKELTTPKATTTKLTTKETTTKESTTPKATTTKLTTKETTTKESTTPKATTTKLTTKETTTKESTTPKATTTKLTTKESTTPKKTTTKSATMKSTTTELTTKESTSPRVTTMESATIKPTITEMTTTKLTTTTNVKKKMDIECITNCKPLLNPTIDLYLETKTNFIGKEFKWYYQLSNDTDMKSVDNIALMDVPSHILVVKKNTLKYGTTYKFIVKYSKYELTNNIIKTTIVKPEISGCTVQPQSGEAGITLFNISCINFTLESNTEYIFEYYQRNKNDDANDQNSQLGNSNDDYSATNGVLLYRGNDTMTNVKLSCCKYLTVRKINKQGISADVNLLVNVSRCDKKLLTSLFKELKTHLIHKDNSRAITIIAILSDILHDNHINKFDQLFMALNQIPIENCISCTFQFSLILKKVINDYYKTNDGKINIAKIISKQLTRVSNSLCNFVEVYSYDNRGVELQKIDKIKEGLQNNMAFLQNSILQYNNENDTDRYYWSSIDNIIMTTHNMEKLLLLFGKSIIMDLSTYKRPISCAHDNYQFEACIVSPEWLRNRSKLASNTLMYDTIGEALASELLSKGGDWGVTIFNVNNDLIRTFESADDIKIILPIVSLDVSNFDQSNSRNLHKHKEFENYFDLHFKTNETIQRPRKNYTIKISAPNSNNFEFDKNVMVYRIDMSNIAELFLTISDLSHDLRFVWLRDKRPDTEIMVDKSYSHTLTAGKINEFKLKTLGEHRNEIHYIGISADMNEKFLQSNEFNVSFSMDIFSPQCLYWTGIKWKADGIIIGPNSTENDIHCQTKHTSLFTGLLLTLPHIEDPFIEIYHIENISNNLVCIFALTIVFLIYIILLGWSVNQDNKDASRGKIIILNDNYPGEDEVYYVTVYTGNMPEAGTTANVCLRLHGNVSASRAHWLNGSGNDVLQRFHDDKFIIFTPKNLGDLKYIHVWHDSHGNHPNWYCKRIEVTDVRMGKIWYFEVERWFSLLLGIKNTEHIILAESLQNRKIRFIDEVILNVREDHLWISVFFRHPRSSVTRCQRLSNILCAQLSVMLTNLLFYRYVQGTDNDEYFITLEITPTQIWIAIFSNLIQILVMFFTSYFFNKGYKLQENIVVQDQEHDQNKPKKTWWEKLLCVIAEEKLYLIAQTEINLRRKKEKKYWIIGWIICIAIYIIMSFFIILYGMKFGTVKSLHWITTIVIAMLQSTLVVEPLLIAISSLVWWLKSDQEQNKINNYQIKLDNFRKNTKNLIQNFRLIQRIRKNRYRYLYNPLTTEKAQDLQNKQNNKIRSKRLLENIITCLLLILISLCCRSALYNTHKFLTPELIQTNDINKIFLENLFKRNMVDIEMIKTFLSESLIPHLHVKEYYNGISIINKSIEHSIQERGRFSLYNSKLINGGVRLVQNRIRQKNVGWEDDTGIYTEKWIKIDDKKKLTAWTYRSIPVIKYFNIWSPVKITSGFILDLIGDRMEYKNILNTHLENGWLDDRTINLVIEFQMYTPIADCITVFKIGFQSTSGSLYVINKEVWTVPSSAAFVTLSTHMFTMVFVSACAAAAVWLTSVWLSAPAWLVSADDPDATGWRFWTAYERTLMVLVACTAFAVAGRRELMMVAEDRYVAVKETAYAASVVDACHAHEHVGALTTLTAFAATVRAFALEWSSSWSPVV